MNPRDRANRGLVVLSLIVLSCAGSLLSAYAHGPALSDCTELAQNGGFEAGNAGWQQFSAQGYELISDFNPRGGVLSAYLAGVNDADDRLRQTITLPGDMLTVTLEAWWFLATAETGGAFDTMTVSLLTADGAAIVDLLTVDNTAAVGVWDRIALDLSAYAGQTVAIQFAARTDANNISDFYLDDVSVLACPSGTAPTASPTATPPPTATQSPTTSPTATVSATPTPTATLSPTASPTATVSATASPTRSATPSTTANATGAPTGTASPSATPTPTASSTATPFGLRRCGYLPSISIAGGLQ
jgi:hypothetical protein